MARVLIGGRTDQSGTARSWSPEVPLVFHPAVASPSGNSSAGAHAR